MSPLSTILLSPVTVILSESGEQYAHIKHCLLVKTVLNSSKHICQCILNKRTVEIEFFTGGSIIMEHFCQKDSYKHATFHFTTDNLIDKSCAD